MKLLMSLILFSTIPVLAGAQMGSANSFIPHDTLNSLSPGPATGTGFIIFPTAFMWNRNGPTGGYWQDNQPDDHVFRPVFRNVEEYTLKIFNRKGLLIYESADLHKGWDGYLENGDLAFQGVYIWQATGIFNDGTAFSKKGDVTFIY